jgi:anti-sigma factor RsiW
MICLRKVIDGYLDDELDLQLQVELEDHMATCQDCAQAYLDGRAQQATLRSTAPYYVAPHDLEQRIRLMVSDAAAPPTGSLEGEFQWRWLAIAACLTLAVSAVWNVALLRSRVSQGDALANTILASHLRSMLGDRLLEVSSSDQHTVKPWFAGKTDFSPEVKDFASDGFPLAGGRIEFVSDRSVAALIYRHGQHVINLFTWPANSSDPKRSHFVRNGYNIAQWSDASMTYWAVSDISTAEMDRFQDLCLK